MRVLAVLVVAAALAAGAARGAAATPEQIVRSWSSALNANDNERAARLFAPGAQVLQGALALRLTTHRLAVLFNASLPCAGRIVFMQRKGTQVLATFVLGERPAHRCDDPGGKASAVFDVRNGKIVLWAQVQNPPARAQPAPKPKPKKKPGSKLAA
jgi:hypothetical protein